MPPPSQGPAELRFRPDDPRVRILRGGPENPKGELVLYVCQIFRRPTDNAALAYALEEANARKLPLLVYEAIRPDYAYASDRFHTFLLEGAREMAAALATRGIGHVFFLPRTKEEARGVLAKVAARAALVVSDDSPAFLVPAQNEALSRCLPCPFVVVDDAAGVPLSLFPKEEFAARTLRPKLNKVRDTWLVPLHEPKPVVNPKARWNLPFDPLDLGRVDIARAVAACAIDHGVGPVEEFPGGAAAAEERLQGFLRRKLRAYPEDRNEPARDGTSHLSPYLHFGMVSPRRVALEARAWAADHRAEEIAEAWLEQLLVRRGLAFNFAARNPRHRTYDALPAWARASLAEHCADKRPALVDAAQLEEARSPDEVWNAAQLELRARGVIHNYVRMLWGKLVLTWMERPEDAHRFLVEQNDRYALDGRDPDGYANIGWCFGLHDRPWPTRPIYGKVRSMTTRSALSKLEFDGYLSQARTWRGMV